MSLLKRLSIFIILIAAISSCNVNNGFIQKRKYQKGYHLSMKKKINNSDRSNQTIEKVNQNENLAQTSIETEHSFKNEDAKTETSVDKAVKEEEKVDQPIIEKSEKIITPTKERVVTVKKGLTNKLNKVIENNPVVNSNTASKTNSNGDSDIVTIILIVLLILLALALFALIDGMLGGLLSLILLIIVVVLLLRYFDVI